MSQNTVSASQLCIGIDLGDKYSHLCVFNRSTGEVLEESRIRTTPEALTRRFGSTDACRIAIEVGGHSPWIGRLLKAAGHDVIVANSNKLRLIYENDSKSDRVDAEYLARLASADPKLLHPIQPRGERVQISRALITARDQAIHCRTRLINSLRGMVKSLGERLPPCNTSAFHRKCRGVLPQSLESAAGPLFEALEGLARIIKDYDKEIDRLCAVEYPETARLQQIPGVGPITSLDYVLTIEDPTRFERSRSVGAYVGMRPARKKSSQQDPELAITKAGDGRLRSHLVNCAHYILGPFGPDCDLKRWGLKLAARGGKRAKKRAIVAVARKLAVLLHRLWITGDPYDPFHNSERAKTRT